MPEPKPEWRCATCRHCIPFEDPDDPGFDGRAIAPVVFLGWCRLAELNEYLRPPFEERIAIWDLPDEEQTPALRALLEKHMGGNLRLAMAQDGSDYHASLLVRGEFGCVQWEPGSPDEDAEE